MPQQIEATDFAHGVPDIGTPQIISRAQNQGMLITDESSATDDGDFRRVHTTNNTTPFRKGTLKKKQSLSRQNSTKRNASRISSRPGSVKSLTFADETGGESTDEMNSAFWTPVPTTGSPTDVLANRFQLWRRVLKDLITYFRDIQKTYDARSKSSYTLSNVITNIVEPPEFMVHGGINEAVHILRGYHKRSIAEGNKAKLIEEEIIAQLAGLRSDLGQKIKEIKSLAGDFKNSVEKETEGTRRAVTELEHALKAIGTDPKSDPYLVRLAVDRQVGRQIEEENYLHRAFLNLESSGRELESIVMGEVQKAYNAYAGIVQREADDANEAAQRLRNGPLAIPKDLEWRHFIKDNKHFVDPRLPVRKVNSVSYPGKYEAGASEVRAGMLERKSKYLKSYSPGWYVLSTTHLHEFKSPDRIASQAPIMSLPLAEQKLGSHSSTNSTSHKFMLKGRQSGGLHRGHAWVFRAESYDTMMAWFSDIKNLTEKSGAERTAFIQRSHTRSISGSSHKAGSVSSDERAMDEDEADAVPYSATASQGNIAHATQQPTETQPAKRPSPGGRFPSALNINHRDSQLLLAPSSPSSSRSREVIAAAGALPGSDVAFGTSDVHEDRPPTAGQGAYVGASTGPTTYDLDLSAAGNATSKSLEKHTSDHDDRTAPIAISHGGAASGIEDPYEPKPEARPSLHPARAGSSMAQLTRSATQSSYVPPMLNATDLASISNDPHPSAPLTTTLPRDGISSPHREDPALPIRMMVNAEDPGEPIRDLAIRPPLSSYDSAITISGLHVPGEFPGTKPKQGFP